jgi:hypothetical protein
MGVATAQSEVHRLSRVVLKDPRAAFRDDATVERQWRDLNYLAAPSLGRAIDEYERFVELLRGTGTEVAALPENDSTTLDSIYVRDGAIVSDRRARRLPDGSKVPRDGSRAPRGRSPASGAAARRSRGGWRTTPAE